MELCAYRVVVVVVAAVAHGGERYRSQVPPTVEKKQERGRSK